MRSMRALSPKLIIMMAAAVTGCRDQAPPPQASQRSAAVELIQPAVVSLPRHVRVTGTLHGQEETTVAAKVTGRIVEIARDVGDPAQPGDALAKVDPTDYLLERDEATLALAQALAELGLEELPQGSFDVTVLPTVQRAELQARNTQARFDRGRQLFEQEPPLISEQDFADLRTAWEVSEADRRVAVLTAEARLAESRTLAAQLRIAEQQLNDTDHRVPSGTVIPGDSADESQALRYWVSSRMISIGDLVQVGTPLFRLIDLDPIKLRAPVPERQALAIQVGQAATVQTDAHPDSVNGQVSRVNPSVNVQTRTFEVEILIPNADRSLKPGAFARAQIEIGHQSGAILIPMDCVVTFAGVTKVYVVEDGKTIDRPVALGVRVGQDVEIVKGLGPADQLVRRPSADITGGMAVQGAMGSWTPSVAPPATASTGDVS